MPTIDVVRARIIRYLRSEPSPAGQTKLLQSIGESYRSQAEEQISQMLSEQVLIRLGLGRRGSPYQLIFGPNASITCPCCGQQTKLVQNG